MHNKGKARVFSGVTIMDRQQLKRAVVEAIDRRGGELIAFGDDIFAHPELGYKEFRTAAKVEEKFRAMGISYQSGIGITGLKARLPGKENRVSFGIMGELDSVLCPAHPNADPVTGAAHACGHNGMLTAMLGAGMGLADAGAMDYLGGDVVLIGMPAEEYVEIEYRNGLRQAGKIKFLGGKQQWIVEGAFADIDMVSMIHMASDAPFKLGVAGTSNGFIGKFIRYSGREAHSGAAPHAGVNALNAAMLGLMGVHAQRETLRDDDSIRIHPIITKGGDLVNIVPADVRLEAYVRGKRVEGIVDASHKVDRALKAGAMAIGADVEITNLPGYLPRISDSAFDSVYQANCEWLVGAGASGRQGHGTASNDIGDLSHLMPTAGALMGGVTGQGHSKDVRIVDPETFYLAAAKLHACTAIDLLWGGAETARSIVANYRPVYPDVASYLAAWADLIKA